MGCCLSAGNHILEAKNRRSIDGELPTSPCGILQVETVKEVLLETTVAPKPQGDKFKPMSQEWKLEVRKPPMIARKDVGKSLSTAAAIKHSAAVNDGVVDQLLPLRKLRANSRGRVAARRVAAPQPEKRGQVAARRVAAPQPVRGRSPVRGEEVAPPRKECDRKSPAAGEAATLENPFVSLEGFIFL